MVRVREPQAQPREARVTGAQIEEECFPDVPLRCQEIILGVWMEKKKKNGHWGFWGVGWGFFPAGFGGEKGRYQCAVLINQRKQEVGAQLKGRMLASLVLTRTGWLWVTHNSTGQNHRF